MKSRSDIFPLGLLRRLLPALALALPLLCGLNVQAVQAGVKAMLLINLNTGKTLYERNANMSIPPASLTKLMTMYLAMDAVSSRKLSLMGKVRVTREAARTGGSSMHLRTGERLPLSRLMLGMAVASGNDAAMTVAHAISGSTRNFVRLMNRKARNIGLRHTVFKNPSGLPAPGQKTTARDMAKLARAYLKAYPSVRTFHATRRLVHRGRAINNTNQLLGRVRGVDGLKTGFTVASGYNVIITAERNGVRLMAVVMGGSSRATRDNTARRLVEAGFAAPGSPARVKRLMAGRRR
ncbi:D-alanyl-D-alanine carboxypeptidase family protein [uncultured Desulfovibrio sp.]|uniref:D-alanyl-D-alanine carboxypeptidase family protein n=1 Tax=uncultured Desulfovibrio sp. TaxID=167968 RepID=UPI0025DBD4BF|nr:D-alanyl-D-alanine carboxypeptidase family protein [uncultured Desulfovibrio sp.]